MGLINFIRSGFFKTLFGFSGLSCAGLWFCLLLGAAAQILLNKKAKFSQYSRLFTATPTFLYIYGLALCLLIGIAVPAIVFWIRNRRAGDKGSAGAERPDDKK